MANIAIATMTSDSKGDSHLQLEALAELARHKYPVFVADGGSSDSFISSLVKMGHRVNSTKGILTFQQKEAVLRACSGADVVLYTEPDKLDWFNNGLEPSIDQYMQFPQGLGVIARTPEAMATFTEHQQCYETKANQVIGLRTGVEGDFVYGPKIFTNSTGRQLEGLNEDVGWGTMTYLVALSHRLGEPIKMIWTAAECPQMQRNESNREYRHMQYYQNLLGFFLGLATPMPMAAAQA